MAARRARQEPAAARRARQEPKYVFKKKSHEEQSKINDKIDETMREAEAELQPGGSGAVPSAENIKAALDALKQGRAMVAERQKLIKIADRSELGWAVVHEYTADELAANSDDEKRMEKAAERKAARKRKAVPAGKSRAKRSTSTPFQPHPSPTAQFQLPLVKPHASVHHQSTPKLPGPCYVCGQFGHLKSYCPKNQASGSKTTWYPLKVHSGTGLVCGRELVHSESDDVGGSELAALPMLHQLEESAPSEVHSEAQLHVLSKGVGDQVLGAADGSCRCYGGHVHVQGIHGGMVVVPGSCKEVLLDGCAADISGVVDSVVVAEGDLEEVTLPCEIMCGAEVTSEAISSTIATVKGRLKECVLFWKEELVAPQSVLSIIESGYALPLKSEPPMRSQKNQPSAYLKSEFVQASIDELLVGGCIKLRELKPHICSPLSVVANSTGKLRLVVNLRYLNKYLWKQKFKYEDLRTAMLLLEHNDYLFSFDLKSGYHHVDIVEAHQKFLGIEWGGAYYVFTVLPFGLSTACYVFTKLMRPLVRYWRASGIRIVLYLDDGLATAADKQSALKTSIFVRETLSKAGFVTHPVKSQWSPVQRLSWLGFVIDTSLGQLEVPSEKITLLRCQLQQILSMDRIPARLLASVVGKIIAMGLAIGPLTRFMTRSVYTMIESRYSWCDHLQLSSEAERELAFWEKRVSDYNAHPFWRAHC